MYQASYNNNRYYWLFCLQLVIHQLQIVDPCFCRNQSCRSMPSTTAILFSIGLTWARSFVSATEWNQCYIQLPLFLSNSLSLSLSMLHSVAVVSIFISLSLSLSLFLSLNATFSCLFSIFLSLFLFSLSQSLFSFSRSDLPFTFSYFFIKNHHTFTCMTPLIPKPYFHISLSLSLSLSLSRSMPILSLPIMITTSTLWPIFSSVSSESKQNSILPKIAYVWKEPKRHFLGLCPSLSLNLRQHILNHSVNHFFKFIQP